MSVASFTVPAASANAALDAGADRVFAFDSSETTVVEAASAWEQTAADLFAAETQRPTALPTFGGELSDDAPSVLWTSSKSAVASDETDSTDLSPLDVAFAELLDELDAI